MEWNIESTLSDLGIDFQFYRNTQNKKTFRNVKTIQQGKQEDLCYCSFDGEEAISLISQSRAGIILCKRSLKEVGPYHVFVESKAGRRWRNWVYEINLTKDQVLGSFMVPFQKNAKKIVCSGEVFETEDVGRMRVYYTTDRLEGSIGRNDQFRLDGKINQNGIDVTREFLEDSKKYTIRKDVVMNSKEIFIVHGHDEAIKYELARIIDKEFHLEAKILHEEPDKGRTIIEKLEGVSELPGYAFILLTPDDLGAVLVPGENAENFNDPHKRPAKQKTQFEYRARQNVILELGYFIGLLGRDRVCCLYKEGVELPSDISGVLYKRFKKNISEITWDIGKELKAAGYDV